MTALRLLRPVLVVLAVLASAGAVRLLAGGDAASLAVGPLHLDLGLVNLLLAAYIAGLLWLLARYSSTNLRGQERLSRFGALFAGLGASLLLLVLAGNLVTAAVAWTASGVLLALLVSHAGGANAVRAGRRVQGAMALSSGLLWVAVALAWVVGLSLDGTDPEQALSSGSAAVVAVLVVLAGVVRSALAPFHRWLPETAEAPSPVSALLHAGIVNATGVIAVLQWDLLSAQPAVLLSLAVLGLGTVVWCSLEQRVRPDVKGRLAASTSAQMGWMALQVGLGAPAAALLHLMCHGAWKAWLFLRAGGAVVRARREPARGELDRSRAWGASVLALTPVAALVAVAVPVGWIDPLASPVHLLLVGMAVLLGVAVGVEAAALERTTAAVRSTVAVIGGATVAGYVAAAVAWEHHVAVGGAGAHAVPAWAGWVALAALVVVAVLARTAVRLHPGSSHPVATLVSTTSLPPGSRVPGSARAPRATRSTPQATAEATDRATVRRTVEMAGRQMGPAWPLRATVAVNPLAGLESLPFDTALAVGEKFHGTALRPSFAWFLDLYDEGRVGDAALARAMDDHDLGGGPRGVTGLLDLTREIVALGPEDDAHVPTSRALAHAHLWSARAWSRAEDRTADLHGPWALWRSSAAHPAYRLATGSPDADRWARSLPDDPAEAIIALLDHTGHAPTALFEVATELLAAGPGWAAHAQWRARRSGSTGPLVELVALRLAMTVLHGEELSVPRPGAPLAAEDPGDEVRLDFLVLKKIWLEALDATTRELLCEPLTARQAVGRAPAPRTPVLSQSVWCIDVRSERIRRHLESTGEHQTFGFAGFFGIAGRATDADGTSFDQCPVIVDPTVEVVSPAGPLAVLPAMTRAATRVAARPGLGFAVAEASGLAAFVAALLGSRAPRAWHRLEQRARRGPAPTGPLVLRDLADPDRVLTVAEQADAAEALLRTIGLTDGFAPVVVLAGHGSTTENNAYATAYDCGACGGNPGLLNARAMAQALNDDAVRAELGRRGIVLPASTRVLAALHDTTTDRVEVHRASAADDDAADRVAPALDEAGRRTAAERRPALPGRDLAERATDWSEPMPEWGLAGCSAIIVGPRDLTRGLDLAGRTFLHSYDRRLDPDGATLTAILNAPVVVSQWIASQYWFSSVAPSALGAGDKTTHNVVGDIGVLSGAHGDLRTGLPWQALFAHAPGSRPSGSSAPQHVPSRHLVVVDADPEVLAHALRQSPAVVSLLDRDWMRMVVLDRGHAIDALSLLAAGEG